MGLTLPRSKQPPFPYGSGGPSTCPLVEHMVLEQEGKSWAGKRCWFGGLTLTAAQEKWV